MIWLFLPERQAALLDNPAIQRSANAIEKTRTDRGRIVCVSARPDAILSVKQFQTVC